MRVVPVDRVAVEFVARIPQQLHDRFTVDPGVVLRIAGHAGDLENGRVVVDGDDRLFADAAAPRDSGPVDDARHANATLVRRALAGAQRCVLGRPTLAVEPTVVSAPMDGVVAAIHVEPNQTVKAGTPLLELDDTTLRNRRDVAKRALAVAEAQLQRAAKRAFRDAESKAQVSVLEAKVAEKAAELSFNEELLTRIRLDAVQDGIAVFRDPNEWIGRPVRTGERIMIIADPAKTELSMDLPVDDAIDVDEGARVLLFLNVDPLNPREAFLVSASYQAALSEKNVLAFRLRARFPIGEARPRLGLKGTAKIYADEVPLWLFLFRKPISVVRRMLGL